jgi:competence protein ComEA
VYEAGEQSDSGRTKKTGKENDAIVYVDIAGAVEKPGVYEVPDDSRVADVVTKAGGLSAQADQQAIAKSMNLAAKVSDAMKIYVPFSGETPLLQGSAGQAAVMQTAVSGQSGMIGNSSTQTGELINVNTATQTQLDSLPGIGSVTSAKIIAGRPYTSIEELKTKKVVGASVYEKIKDLVTVN